MNEVQEVIVALLEEFKQTIQSKIAKKQLQYYTYLEMKGQVEEVSNYNKKLLRDHLNFISNAVSLFQENALDKLETSLDTETYIFLKKHLNKLEILLIQEHEKLLLNLEPKMKRRFDDSYFKLPELQWSYSRVLNYMIQISEKYIYEIMGIYTDIIFDRCVKNYDRRRAIIDMKTRERGK